ncbi:MAG: DinB family protein [Chitinophagaceae bacterium]|uniref:DinB-like domain-containing protein n=1 Tax=marine sediment metagenome TaxID=412755 RepID=X1SPT9_9ZZZZ|nr:DinB family protein [Chitinophagaceae bacterium]
MQLQKAVNTVFAQLSATIENLSNEEYSHPCVQLSNNTIGQHVRHIIEMFQCLELGYETGIVNYEKRKRDGKIETDRLFTQDLMKQIQEALNKPNKDLLLEGAYDEQSVDLIRLQSNYFREIAYNLEHTIHHMALIRIGVQEISSIELPESFGVASATVKFRNQCAQ